MLIAWMLYAMALALAITAAAWLAERAMRLTGGATRWVWCAAVAATVALPIGLTVAGRSLPRHDVPVGTGALEGLVAGEAAAAGAPGAAVAVETLVLPAALRAADRPVAVAWIALSTLIALAWLRGARRLARQRRRWRAAHIDGEPILVSAAVGPAVVGWVRGAIVLPEWALDLHRADRELLLAHEREHLTARDHTLTGLCALAALCLPWQLPLWWQLRRLRLAAEIDCDARVLCARPDVAGYGRLLLEVGQRGTRPALAAAFAEPPSSLERRIRTMLSRGRTIRWGRARAAALLLGAAALVALACDVPRPVAPLPAGEVPLAALTDRMPDYNVSEPVTPELVRQVLRVAHPELLERRTGESWVVYVIADAGGRIESTHKAASTEYAAGSSATPGARVRRLRATAEAAAAAPARPTPADTDTSSGTVGRRLQVGSALESQHETAERPRHEVEPRALIVARDVTLRSHGEAGPTEIRISPAPGSTPIAHLEPADIESIQVFRIEAGTFAPDRIGVIWIVKKAGRNP